MIEIADEGIDPEASGGGRRLSPRPAACRGHLEGRNGALRLRLRDDGRAAPGRLLDLAVAVPPGHGGGADHRNETREGAAETHVIPPVDGACLLAGERRHLVLA